MVVPGAVLTQSSSHHPLHPSLWTVFNFFMGGVIGSTALAQLPEFVEKPMEIPNRLGYALPSSAKFFLTYLILRTFMTVPLRFLLPQPGVWQAWVR